MNPTRATLRGAVTGRSPSPATCVLTGEARERVRAFSPARTCRRLSGPRPYYSPSPPLVLVGLSIGGAEGARTPDLDTASVALSQLSYSPDRTVMVTEPPLGCEVAFDLTQRHKDTRIRDAGSLTRPIYSFCL